MPLIWLLACSLLHPGLLGKSAKLPRCQKRRTDQCLWQCDAVAPAFLRGRQGLSGGSWSPPPTSCPAPACTPSPCLHPAPTCTLLLPSSSWDRPQGCKQEAGRPWGWMPALQEKSAGSGGCSAVTCECFTSAASWKEHP